jgi:DNA repair ATPase RecN
MKNEDNTTPSFTEEVKQSAASLATLAETSPLIEELARQLDNAHQDLRYIERDLQSEANTMKRDADNLIAMATDQPCIMTMFAKPDPQQLVDHYRTTIKHAKGLMYLAKIAVENASHGA